MLLGLAALAACLLPVGCGVGCVWRADRMVRPVVQAVEAFKSQTGRLPTALSELPEPKNGNGGLKLEGSSDVGLVWSISYETRSNGTYVIRFNHVHYDVSYENGNRRDVRFNLFR
jgi:hypothetical protein